MDFDFRNVEDKWRKQWEGKGIYHVTEDPSRPKYYVLDMFPYPSGAGLHVGHPLGYVASDIYARYKRLKGFNVLHPMGYDAFGLPAEQYAIETGTPPEVTTEKAIATYRSQLDKIGFSFDWSRQVKTCDPSYYKWTQWIFLQLFGSWYNRANNKAENISTLEKFFAENGCINWPQHDADDHEAFTAAQWNAFSKEEQQKILMHYRIAYQSYSEVNWCEALGTVLANDEVKDGKSERGGYPVERRKMRQWFLRITEYADRLLASLDTLDWSEAMKDMQRNWIGKSEGALIQFHLSQTLSTGEGFNSPDSIDEKPRYFQTDQKTWKHNIIHAKDHRHHPTESEDKVWQQIRANKIGFKIRREHPIGRFIADFVCIKKMLVIEIDGEVHDETQTEDAIRTQELADLGFEVIRFKNEEVLSNIDAVVNAIKQKLSSMPDKNIREEESIGVSAGKTDPAVPPLSFRERPGERWLFVFTTRPDTIYGATFMVIAPESDLVKSLTTPGQQKEIDDYIAYVKSRTDVERQQEKKVTGAFTGSYAVNPFTGKNIPIYIAEYVLAGYGTGAIMAVPANDERDRKFAEKFGLPIIDVIDQSMYPNVGIEEKVGKMINSGDLNGMEVKEAIKYIIDEIEELGIGKRKINYRLRDAGYSRQRYWGEPFPIIYKNDIPYPLPISELPVELPKVDSYKPSGDGRSPLANSTAWIEHDGGTRETDTMPGYAGSSWYFLRYMDPHNDTAFASKDKIDYWQNVDLYLGGSEHAVGHLLYARLWHKFLHDMGYVLTEEPFKKLVNQGMIQGVSPFMCEVSLVAPINRNGTESKQFKVSFNQIDFKSNTVIIDGQRYGTSNNEARYRLPYNRTKYVGGELRVYKDDIIEQHLPGFPLYFPDTETYVWLKDENNREYLVVETVVEKMSKSRHNVVNPDEIIERYGADCFRMFEMFLGPLDQSKPWDDKGIDGVGKFIRRFWRLFYDEKGQFKVTSTTPAPSPLERAGGEVKSATPAELKVLHKTLKKISEDIERLQFNTCISQFMICLNELNDLKCNKREILEPLLIALAPFAPFMTEELWQAFGNEGSIHHATYPTIEQKYLVESSFNYPISINGKTRAEMPFALDMAEEEIKAAVLANDIIQKWTNGAVPKKFVFVKGRIINVVV